MIRSRTKRTIQTELKLRNIANSAKNIPLTRKVNSFLNPLVAVKMNGGV